MNKEEQDIQKLKMLFSVKNKFEKQLNFQMSMFLKKDKINKIFKDLDYSLLDDGCDLEIDMRRSLSVVNKLDDKIHDILIDYNIDLEDYEEYTDFIVRNNYFI